MYLEVKLHEDRCGWCIYKLKNYKIVELTYSETNKQVPTYRWSFSTLDCSKNIINAVLRGCKAIRKVQHLYLTFKSLKIKRVNRVPSQTKSKKQGKTDAFGD